MLGAIVLIGSLSKKATETHVDRFDWRIVFLVIGSVIVYALVLKLLGVYIAVFLLVVLSSLASHEFSLKVALANGVFLVVFTYLAFIKGLGLIFPLWPSFI
ncbi:tripartite tricarboxylate transporter TctB family protein [Bordetella holmesii 70147]|nr:tripartite tricarboxylate transporter TctB family protein [Bordetella holmesii 70147]